MLDILKTELEKYKIFEQPDHPFVNALVRAVPFSTVSEKMKTVFAISHISSYASQFRRNVELWDGTPVPTNNISFVIADSGANKDSTNSKIKNCFKPGYKTLEKFSREVVKKNAIQAAKDAGEDMYEEFAVYKQYLKPVPPTFMAMSTGPGLVQHINDIGALPALAGSVYSGELSDELANNPHALENIKILAEVYDLGDKEVSYTKGVEHRSKEIEGQPVSALLVGSPGHILYDESTRKKFHVAFMSKLARRSWFCYSPERIYEPDFSQYDNPIKAMHDYAASIEQESSEAIAIVSAEVNNLTKYNLNKLGEPLKTVPEVFELFNVYKRYNRDLIDSMNAHETVYALVRAHLQWKAIKLAGAFAVVEQCDTVTLKHYVDAIRYCEMLDNDITTFETDINKAPHERLSDYLRGKSVDNGKAVINIHDIKKLGFSSAVSHNKLLELATLCAGYDDEGIYVVSEGNTGIEYEPYIKTETIGVSFKPVDNDKLQRAISNNADYETIKNLKMQVAATANSGYTYGETTFAELREMLNKDFAFSSFQFKDGERHKENLVGGTKWLVLDVDRTHISIEDAHEIMQGVNHHIVLTSDPTNKYKYRVIVELDSFVDIGPIEWKYFYMKLSEDLGLQVDVLPQSQIFFSYKGREVFSCLDGTPIECREYLMYAKERKAHSPAVKAPTKSQKSQELAAPFDTFWYAFECQKGRRSVTYYRAVRHAMSLGADYEYTINLLDQFNEYLTDPLDQERFDRLKQQVRGLYEEQAK